MSEDKQNPSQPPPEPLDAPNPCTPSLELSPRQLECLHRIALGETTAEIAAALGLSRHTVDHYVGAACSRLGARSRAQAVAIAIGKKIIDPCRSA
jgi:DNA-binding CsgD family transcriptional regulator